MRALELTTGYVLTALLIHLGTSVSYGAEPKYQGKRLGQWVELYENARADSAEENQAVQALKAIGSNAIPYLVKWIADPSASDGHYLGAADSFAVFGAAGSPAIPELARLLESTNQLSATLAGTALGHIGKPSLPALMHALTNRMFRIGTQAALTLVELGTNARPAVPILLRQLEHPNHFVRERAADTLGKLSLEPEAVVPALAKLLNDNSPAARFLALQGLAEFGANARSAVPAISNLFANPDPRVRSGATNALRKIDQAGFSK